MLRRKIALTGALLAALALSGRTTTPANAADAAVNIDNFAFTPPAITVAAGTTVTWANRDDIPHTVVDAADPRSFKSSPLDTGDSFSVTFKVPGTYHYYCSLHPHMQGTVVVK